MCALRSNLISSCPPLSPQHLVLSLSGVLWVQSCYFICAIPEEHNYLEEGFSETAGHCGMQI